MTWEVASVIIAAIVPLTAVIVKFVPSHGKTQQCKALCTQVEPTDFVKLREEVRYLRESLDELKTRVTNLHKELGQWMRQHPKPIP